MKSLLMAFLTVFLCGCQTLHHSLPKGYSGSTASIVDSYKRYDNSKAAIFFVEQISDKKVYNAYIATFGASRNQGQNLVLAGWSRKVATPSVKVKLKGALQYSAPISEIFDNSDLISVEGIVNFSPEENKEYIVRGKLSENTSSVWISDQYGNVASDIVVVKKVTKQLKTELVKSEIKTNNNHGGSRQDVFNNLVGGETDKLVKAKLGTPNDIEVYEGNSFTFRKPHITYFYDGLGKLQFSAAKINSEIIPRFITRVTPELANLADKLTLEKQLMSVSGIELQQLAKQFYLRNNLNQEVLDLVAQKAWLERKAENTYTADGVAWLCKVLGKSKKPRYRDLLSKLQQKQFNSKIRRHSKASLKLLPMEDIEQFLPEE